MKVVILGGAGLMAEAIERDLLDTELDMDGGGVSEIVVADVSPDKVKARVDELQSPKVSPAVIDLMDHKALVKLIKGHDVVINAAPTPTTLNAARGALEAGAHFMGLVGVDMPNSAPDAPKDELGQPTEAFLDQLDEEYKKAGLTGIMGMGSMPGTSNIMARYFVDKLDTVESIVFSYVYASLTKTKTFFQFSPAGMIGQYTTEPIVLRDGKLIRIPPRSGRETALYPEPIGMRELFYILHPEAYAFFRSFRDKGLKNAGTKAGWGPDFLGKMEFLDSVGLFNRQPIKVGDVTVSPLLVFMSVAAPKPTAEKVVPKDYGCTRAVVRGEKSGEKLEYTGDLLTPPYKELNAAQYRTGLPTAIATRMIKRGDIKRKGAFTPEVGVDPEIYLGELARRGQHLTYTVKYYV